MVATTGVFINFKGNDTARIPDPAKLTFEGFIHDRMTEVHPSATLFLASSWLEIGEVDEHIPGGYAEDYDWLLRAARIAPIAAATEPLVRVYWHGASFFFERWRTIDEALGYLVDKFPEFHDDPVGLARIRGQQAVAQAAMGERRRAFRTIYETLRLSPRSVGRPSRSSWRPVFPPVGSSNCSTGSARASDRVRCPIPALVAQGIEHRPPEPCAQVRILPRAHSANRA